MHTAIKQHHFHSDTDDRKDLEYFQQLSINTRHDEKDTFFLTWIIAIVKVCSTNNT